MFALEPMLCCSSVMILAMGSKECQPWSWMMMRSRRVSWLSYWECKFRTTALVTTRPKCSGLSQCDKLLLYYMVDYHLDMTEAWKNGDWSVILWLHPRSPAIGSWSTVARRIKLGELSVISCVEIVAPGFTFHVPTSSSPKQFCALVKCLNTTSLNWLITLDCLWIYLPSGLCPRKPTRSVWFGFKKLGIYFPAMPTNSRGWITSSRTDFFDWLVWFYIFAM